MHVGLVEGAVEHLDVATATVNVLLVLNGELHNQGLVPERYIEVNKVIGKLQIIEYDFGIGIAGSGLVKN